MERPEHTAKCSCGAISVTIEGESYSMEEKDFNRLFPDEEIEGSYGNCDYCVNHWGIDLCNCGSGDKVGKCENDFEDCRNNKPAQTLGEERPSLIELMNQRGGF